MNSLNSNSPYSMLARRATGAWLLAKCRAGGGRMPDQGPAGVRQARAAETEAALKEAAKRVFDRAGYLNAKITDITADAGRAAGSFYSHFDSKEQLLEALLTDVLDEGRRRAAQPGHSPDFSRVEAVRYHVAGYWDFVTQNRPVVLALNQAAMVSEHFARRQRELLAPLFRELVSHLDYVTAAGGTLPGDPAAVADAMTALMSGYAFIWLTADSEQRGPRPSADEAVDMLARLILNGIMGPPPGRAGA
jgi:AcrR family transcriptional regulator